MTLADLPTAELRVKTTGGGFVTTLVDADDADFLGAFNWRLSAAGYVYRSSCALAGETGKNIIYLHRMVCWTPKGKEVDHIDRDKLNNRSCNLRPVTHRENMQNVDFRRRSKSRRRGTSGYLGVVRNSSGFNTKSGQYYKGNRWVARFNGRYIGIYATAEEAAAARDVAAVAADGEYALLNFPTT